MSTSIAFNDGAAATLTNGKPTPADRFSSWEPTTIDVGERAEALGTGVTEVFVFRTDRRVRFTLAHIPAAKLAVMLRLMRHLGRGGSVTVNTGDAASRAYTCVLSPGAEPPRPTFSDARRLEYTMTFDLLSTGTTDLVCLYS